MNKPLISVLMLSYNHEKFIQDSLDSIACNYSIRYDLEIVVIDDGSSDESVRIIKSFKDKNKIPLRLIEKKHCGVKAISKNFNELISLAKGNYISFLASDDSFSPNRFLNQLSVMEADENVAICYANGINIKLGARPSLVHRPKEVELLASNDADRIFNFVTNNIPGIFIQSILVKSNFLKSFKPFDERLIADDWVFNIRAFKEISNRGLSFCYVDQIVFKRNIHNENTSRNTRVHFERLNQVIERYCEDREKLLGYAVFSSVLQNIRTGQINGIWYFIKKLELSSKLPIIAITWIFNLVLNKVRK